MPLVPSARRGSPGRRNAPNPDPPPNHTRPGCVPGRAVSLDARCVSDESHSCRSKTSGRRMVAGSAAPPVESSGPSPSGYRPSVRVAIGLQRSVPPRPPPAASYAVRVPRAGSPPTTAFPLHPCHAVAVRLGVPTTRVSGGTSTPLVTSRSAFASQLSDVLTDVGAPCPAHTEKAPGS